MQWRGGYSYHLVVDYFPTVTFPKCFIPLISQQSANDQKFSNVFYKKWCISAYILLFVVIYLMLFHILETSSCYYSYYNRYKWFTFFIFRSLLSTVTECNALIPGSHFCLQKNVTLSYLVAFLSICTVAIRVREVDMTRRVLHDFLDISSPFTDHMRVFSMSDIHLQSDFINLKPIWEQETENRAVNSRTTRKK